MVQGVLRGTMLKDFPRIPFHGWQIPQAPIVRGVIFPCSVIPGRAFAL
jgi:hypothetical protein